ncbi:MAG: S41 family peptidase [Bacteroides sp.]
MRYKILNYHLAIYILLLSLVGCIREENYTNDPLGNFEELWKIIDEKYCFFSYKDIDWKAVHDEYKQFITPSMTDSELFEVLSRMLYELKDGHVNLASAGQVSFYDAWYQDYPWNFREDIVSTYYLGKASSDFRTSAGMKYKILNDNVGYIRYESFSNDIGEGNLDEVLSYLAVCNGLIIDVRDNGGGKLSNSTRIAARFTNKSVLTGYIYHKTGTQHDNFSEPNAIYLEPSKRIRWQKKVVVLTNRRCYSATNDFVNAMNALPNTILVGDKTGGGSGLPFSSELPNGWSIRFSASPMLDRNKEQIEFGIDPDYKVNLSVEDEKRDKDTLIETARKLINQQK